MLGKLKNDFKLKEKMLCICRKKMSIKKDMMRNVDENMHFIDENLFHPWFTRMCD